MEMRKLTAAVLSGTVACASLVHVNSAHAVSEEEMRCIAQAYVDGVSIDPCIKWGGSGLGGGGGAGSGGSGVGGSGSGGDGSGGGGGGGGSAPCGPPTWYPSGPPSYTSDANIGQYFLPLRQLWSFSFVYNEHYAHHQYYAGGELAPGEIQTWEYIADLGSGAITMEHKCVQ